MVLDNENRDKILELVYQEPRCIEELRELLKKRGEEKKDWHTILRWTEKIEKTGQIETKVFRKGSRGALRIVHWRNPEIMPQKDLQEKLLLEIRNAKRFVEDFSPFEICQYVDKKHVRIKKDRIPAENIVRDLQKAENDVLLFQGNLSPLAHRRIDGKKKGLDVLREIVEDKKSLRVWMIASIDRINVRNIEATLHINKDIGREAIQIHHYEQPLRGQIVDEKYFTLIEVVPKEGEYVRWVSATPRPDGMFECTPYVVSDPEWVGWLRDIFWEFYNSGTSAEKRLDDIRRIETSQD